MEFKEIVAVSKLSGLYQIHKQRADGLIIKSLIDDKIVFAASRAHTFTPLENITIYTNDEPIELLKILQKIKDYKSKESIPDAKAANEELKSFFVKIIPNYDKERVYISDIQKIVKWYNLLEDKGVIEKLAEDKVEEIPAQVETSEPEPKEKPKTTRKKTKKED